MLTGESDLVSLHYFCFITVMHTEKNAVFADRSGADSGIIGKMHYAGVRSILVIGGMLIVPVKHQSIGLTLVQEDGHLGVNIILIVLVLVKMIGLDIRNNRYVGAANHTVQLERAEFKHADSVRLNDVYLAEQRVSNIAAEVNLIACRLQEL